MSWVDCGVTPLNLMRFDHIYFTHLNGGPCEAKNWSNRRNWAISAMILRDFGQFRAIWGTFRANYGMFWLWSDIYVLHIL